MAPAIIGAAILAPLTAVAASPLTPFGAARRYELAGGVRADRPVLLVGSAAVVVTLAALAGASAWSAAGGRQLTTPRRQPWSATLAGHGGAGPRRRTGVSLAFEHGGGAGGFVNRTTLLIGALGVAGVVGGLAYVESLDELVDRPARWGWQWDVLPDVDPERRDEAVAGLVGLPEAGHVTLVSDRQVLLDGRTVRGHAFDVQKGTAPARLPRRADADRRRRGGRRTAAGP